MRKVKKKNILDKITDIISKDKVVKKHSNNSTKRKNNTNKNNTKNLNNNKSKSNSKNIKNKNQSIASSKSKQKKAKRSIWKKIITFILIAGIVCVFLLTAFLGFIVITAPDFDEKAFNVQDQTVVYDVNGDIITTLGVEKRESVSYDKLPQVLIDAIIATEDSRFFQHNGVDLFRFIKATAYQLIGRDIGGASTLTMQAVKNNLTKKDSVETSKIQKIIRKFQDVYLAVYKVEKEYSKESILEFYINDNYLGGPAYGVEQASKYYFGKSVSELTLPEASLLAGLFQLPGANNPYKNPEGATARRNLVLKYMKMHGYITEEEAELTKKISVESLLVGAKEEDSYQGYIDTVTTEVQKLTGNNPYTVPMKIYTTMEKSIQDGINKILAEDGSYWKDDQVQAGIAIVNVETGAVAAIGAGRNRDGLWTFNYATDAHRQPGSTAKPIFAYGPGIEYNNFSSYTLFTDEPWTYTNGPSVNNWDGKFDGLVTTRYALQYSRNVPALKAYQQVGSKNIQKFAYSLGLNVSLNKDSENYEILKKETGLDNTINEAYSIGGTAEGFTPLEMSSAYAAFASGGYYTEPYTVTKIEYRETGEVIEYKPTKTRVMKDSTAYIMNNILESAVTGGFSGGAYVPGSHVAAKTGTSNYDDATMKKYHLPSNAVNDLWTIAYTSKYSVAVWYGYENTTETTYNTSTGSHKNDLVSAVMKYIPKDSKGWTMPSSVVAVKIEKETWPAKLASEYTPSDLITTEYFVRGTQPTQTSERFAKLNEVNNLQTETNGNKVTLTWEYTEPEILSETYLKTYFNQSVFGNSTDDFIKERLEYNSTKLGKIGFGIYKEEENGSLTLIDFTTEKTYTYTGYGDTKLVIKAEYQIFKSNASSGTTVTLNLGNITSEKLIANLKGKNNVNINAGTYKEEGFEEIYYGKINVTNTAKIEYQVTVDEELKKITTKENLEKLINSFSAGTYKITYIVNYLDREITKERTINIK